jgi:hypothetical protein
MLRDDGGSPRLRLELDTAEQLALFRLLHRHQEELGEDLRRLERSIEREVYGRYTIEELEQLLEPQ